MKGLKVSMALAVAALLGAACGLHERAGHSSQTANQNAPAAATNTNAAGNNATATAGQAATGDSAGLYQSLNCAFCHGADGKGNATMKNIPNFADAAWQKKTTDAEMINVINNGKPPMPPYKNRLTDEQTKGLVAYIRSFAK